MNTEKLRADIKRELNRPTSMKKLAEQLNRCFVALGEQQSDQSSVIAFGIQIEKLLCEKLGRKWSASGISIESLVEDLANKSPAPSPVQSACKLVPVELLEELRDAANEAHNEATRPNRMKFFAALVEQADAILDAPSAPAAQGWIPVSERLPEVPEGDEQEVIVCVRRAHNGQSYTFSARYLNEYPLSTDFDDEPTLTTGWRDVKEHVDYDGWYEPLIQEGSGDEVTHWMPLPAAPAAQSVPGSSAMTKLTIDRELLEELRDAANEAHNEATRPNRMKFFAALVEQADAILDAPSAPGGE